MTKTYTQSEILSLIQTYNATDRLTIKANLKVIKKEYEFQNQNIVEDFGYNQERVKSWFSVASPNVPLFEDALKLAVHYGFDFTEIIQGVKISEKIISI